MEIKLTERGWAGHFIGGHHCLFRRNTLIESGDRKIVVSTVGGYINREGKIESIALNRFYETMAFEAELENGYIEANVEKQVEFSSQCGIFAKTAEELSDNVDNDANSMHDAIVNELCEKMRASS